MKNIALRFLTLIIVGGQAFSLTAGSATLESRWAVTPVADSCNHCLHYTSPAAIWEETLPLGNGRLGMMPDGGIRREHIVLNEISLWNGMETDYCNPDAAKSLPAIRQLLFEGKNREAQELMYSSFVPKLEETDGRYGSYQVLGDLNIDFALPASAPAAYRRWLNLRDAVAYTVFTQDGVTYRREYFVSRDRDVMLVHLTADRPGALNFSAKLSRAERARLSTDGETLLLDGTLDSGNPEKSGMKFRIALRMISDGGKRAFTADNGISLTDGQDAWLLLSATTSFAADGTDFPGERYLSVCDSLLNAANASLPVAKENHTAAHRSLYDRVSLTLPATEDDALPTNERLLRFAQKESPAMAALYYNYGRYLLISATRPGSLPPNLQGLWANTLLTPWNGDYHTNINIQMNYWPLEQAGLPELYQPLTTLMERLIPSGEETARCFYGDEARGWVLHMKTNIWNYTAPGEHPSWGATNTGGAWLCAHLWEHYLYTQDKEYLRRIYPVLKGAARFFSSTTVEEPEHGWLVTAPTSSPENTFYLPGDSVTPVSICMGPTMDVQLLTELYTNVITAARLLKCDADFAARLEKDLKKFPPMQISKAGYLQEWLKDYKEVDVHHRHVSHLYGLHPGNLISPDATPELAEACRATLNRRGDAGTGWSRAWKINFWARLGDGNRAWTLFRSLLHPAVDAETGRHGSGTFPNLFCSHPPFQIDGNYGGAAGIGEMLLQSHEGFIHLLPALPDSWHTGSFRGMRVRGGASVDLDWKDGRAVKAAVTALAPGKFVLKMPAGIRSAEVKIGGRKKLYRKEKITLELRKGDTCEIVFSSVAVRGQINDLPRSAPEAEGVPSRAVAALFDSLMALPQTDIHSVVVLRHGKVIGEIYPEPFAPEYRHTLYSCSKTFVSAAVGLAIDENRLRLTDRVATFFPGQLPDTISAELADMTVRDLLVMASGITPDWEMRNLRADWVRGYLSKPVRFSPGTKFQYDSICTYLLSAIVQKVTGMTVLDYLKQKLFIPMNITEADWEVSPEGFNTGGWGLRLQSESLAKFGMLLLNQGKWQGKQLLPASWVQQMMSKQMETGGDGYGYQMWQCEYPGAVRADGALGQYILVIPDKDMVVVITECTLIDGRRQRRLVWNRLLPEAGNDAMTPGKDYKRLLQKQAAYQLPVVQGKANSSISKEYAGKRIALQPNKFGWQSLSLQFGQKEVVLSVTQTDGDTYNLPFGYKRWLKTEMDAHPPYSITPIGSFNGIEGPFHVAGSYAWTTSETLELKAHYVDWVSALDLIFRFHGQEVELTVKENYSSGKGIVIKGFEEPKR